jgi:hypothetical protein
VEVEHLREKEEQQGHRELEVELEYHLVKGEELECHLGKEEGLECRLGKGEEQGWCCQEAEVEVECQILLGVVEVGGLLIHQSQEVAEGQEHCLLLLEEVVVEEEEEAGLLYPVLLAEVGEVVAAVEQLHQVELVLPVLLVVGVE